MVHKTTKISPFEVVYGFNLLTPLDLIPLSNPSDFIHKEGVSRFEFVKKIHEKVKCQIQHQTERYTRHNNKGKREAIFDEGDCVWLHLSKDIFPKQRKSKLISRSDGPFRVIQRINNNAYRLELPCEYDVIATFNICDLTPFVGNLEQDEKEEPRDLRSNHSQGGGDDCKTREN